MKISYNRHFISYFRHLNSAQGIRLNRIFAAKYRLGMKNTTLITKPTILLSTLVQWTWGLPQNLLGFIIFLICVRKPHRRFRTSIVTYWDRPDSLGCGMFVFLSNQKPAGYSVAMGEKFQHDILVHEYGHIVQSLILGPLFLPVIGVPSFIWASLPVFEKLRERKGLSYYWFYCEKWATKLGKKVTKSVFH